MLVLPNLTYGRVFWYRTKNSTWTFKGSGRCTHTMALSSMSLSAMELQITNVRRRGRLNFYTSSRTNPNDQIFIYFSEERSVGVKTMRKSAQLSSYSCCLLNHFFRLLNILEDKSIQRGIIVFPGNMTPSARKVMSCCFISSAAAITANRLSLPWLYNTDWKSLQKQTCWLT